MATAATERIRELEARKAEIQRVQRIQELEGRRDQLKRERKTTGSDVAQSFNVGLFDTLALPSRVVNAAIDAAKDPAAQSVLSGMVGGGAIMEVLSKLPKAPVEEAREALGETPFAPAPGDEATGFLPRSARILGATVGPSGLIQSAGKTVLSGTATNLTAQVPKRGFGLLERGAEKVGIPLTGSAARTGAIAPAERTAVQQLTAATAASPRLTAAIDLTSSVGAGTGGEVAARNTDNPAIIALAEITGGILFPLGTNITRFSSGRAADVVAENLAPFTKAGAVPRASRRFQELSADPLAEGALIDVDSPVSAAQQTGNPRLIALEKEILKANPELQAKFTDELNSALDTARKQATAFGGEDRTRQILEGGQEHLTNLVNIRARQAAETAQQRIADLGGAETPRDISRIARAELNAALKDIRAQEAELWGVVNKDSDANFFNTKQALAEIKSETGTLVPSRVPAWVIKSTNTTNPVTFNDLQQVRSRILADARAATNKGKFDKARILNNIAGKTLDDGTQTGLLGDMSAVNDPNVANALAFSRQLNEKFTQGTVGSILSRGANQGAGIADADTLNKVFSGTTPATNVRAFLAASPESAPQLQRFIKANFVRNATKDGVLNPTQSQTQINKLEQQGMFEIFPELKNEIGGVRLAAQKAENLAQRAATVTERGGARVAQNSKESLAGVLLDGQPGQEMRNLLQSDNPVQLAAQLRRRMGGNKNAEQGLKSIFAEEMFESASKVGASGEVEVSGQKLSAIFNENIEVAKALGMDGSDVDRMRLIVKQIVQSQQPPGTNVGAIIDDKPSRILSVLVRVMGAQKLESLLSGRGGLGSGLIVAREGASLGQDILQNLTTAEAQKVAVAAISDKPLFKALMLRNNASTKQIKEANTTIESWLIGIGVKAPGENNGNP